MADNELESYIEGKSIGGNRNIGIAFKEAKKVKEECNIKHHKGM